MRTSLYTCFTRLTLIVLVSCSPVLLVAQDEKTPATEEIQRVPHPFLDSEPQGETQYDFWSEFTQMLSTLAFIIFLLLAVAWVMRRALNARMESVNQTSTIRILERRTLSPKATVYLLEVLGSGFLIAETQAGVHRIAELPAGTDLSSLGHQEPTPSGRSFESVLEQTEE